MNDLVAKEVEDCSQYDAADKQREELLIPVGTQGFSLKREYERSRQAAEDVHEDKIETSHMGEAQQIAERILRKTGHEKEYEGYLEPPVSDEVVKTVHRLLLHHHADQTGAENSGYLKGQYRSDRETRGGEQRTDYLAIQEPPHKTGHLSRHRCKKDLEGLQYNKDHLGVSTEGEDKIPEPGNVKKVFVAKKNAS